jgi:predicted dehydrogenase
MRIPHWTTDWQTLISDPKVDIVCVLTPPHTHAEIAIAAAQNDKHLFLEKPLALSLREADEVIAAVERNGICAVVNHIMRYHPLYE